MIKKTDSARHRRAGAGEVVVVGGKRWAMIHELKDEPEPNLDEIFTWLSPSDLVIVEGYKTARIPKIEARRSVQQDRRPLAPSDPTIIAIASDHDTAHGTCRCSPSTILAVSPTSSSARSGPSKEMQRGTTWSKIRPAHRTDAILLRRIFCRRRRVLCIGEELLLTVDLEIRDRGLPFR